MSLSLTDVQKILEQGIRESNLAPAEAIAGLATTLAAAVTPALNDLAQPATGAILTVASTAAPVMSITEAIDVRDAIRRIIDVEVEDQSKSLDAAEALLIANVIDVPSILATTRVGTASNPIRLPGLSTGSHSAVPLPVTVGGAQ